MKKKDIAKKCGIVVLTLALAASGTVLPAASVYATQTAAETQTQTDAEPKTAETQTQSKTEEQEGLQISMQTYKYEFQTKDGIVYKKISFEYPKAEGDSEAADAFNTFYRKLFSKWKKETKNNLKDAKEIVLQRETDDGVCYGDDVSCEVTYNGGDYISILQSGYDYQMGAHGMPYRYAYIFDAKTGKKVSAAGILGLSKKQLNEKVRKLYLKKYKKTPEMFLGKAEDVQKAVESIDFNQNACYIKNGKVRFYVDPYAIAPYAAGFVETAVKMQTAE